jgi:hypothetical protein
MVRTPTTQRKQRHAPLVTRASILTDLQLSALLVLKVVTVQMVLQCVRCVVSAMLLQRMVPQRALLVQPESILLTLVVSTVHLVVKESIKVPLASHCAAIVMQVNIRHWGVLLRVLLAI